MIKESACNAGDTGDLGSIPGLGRSPGGGHGNPNQYSCLENPLDRGAWRTTVHSMAESGVIEATEHIQREAELGDEKRGNVNNSLLDSAVHEVKATLDLPVL